MDSSHFKPENATAEGHSSGEQLRQRLQRCPAMEDLRDVSALSRQARQQLRQVFPAEHDQRLTWSRSFAHGDLA